MTLHSMTMPPAILLILCVIVHKTGMSVFWPAKSLDFDPIEHVWDLLDRRVRARAIPPEMSGNLQVPWWMSGVTSHSKNWQIWCSQLADELQYLMQLVASPDTDCYF